MHIVTRPFRDGDVDLKPGDRVDAGPWPNVSLLVAQRYLREDPEGSGAPTGSAAATTKPRPDGARRTA